MSLHDVPTTDRGQQKALAVGLTALALLVFAFVYVRQVDKNPLRMDEADMYSSIANWVTLGQPLLYLGQPPPPADWLLPLGERTLGDGQLYRFYRIKPETGVQKEFFIALRDGVVGRYTYYPHPQLYLFVHSLLFRLAPLTVETSHLMRYFNLLWVAGMLAGLALLSRELYGARSGRSLRSNRAWWVFAVTLLLLAVNSFFVRASLLIDFQAPTACLAVWYAWAFVRSQERGRLSWPLALVTLFFWFSNFGAPISVLLGTGVYVLLIGWRARPWRALLSVAAGTVAFVPVYWLFSRIFDLPFSQPFIYIANRAGGGGGLAGLVADVWRYSLWYSREIGPWLVIAALALFVLALASRRAIDRPALALAPLLAFTGILSQAAARGDAFHFPKYVYFVAPLLCVFVAGELVKLLVDERDASAALSVTQRETPAGDASAPSVSAADTPPGRHPEAWRRVSAAVMLAALLILSAAQAWRSIQAPGGTLYDPGEVGLVEAAQAARAEAPPDAILLARKDAAFLAQRDFIEWEGPLLTDPALLQQTIEQYGIRYLIGGPLLLGPEAQATWPYLASAFEVVLDAGDYVLLRKY
ncbi:MAG: hypothetical protein WA040_23535 [Anaerolineae bacterium]